MKIAKLISITVFMLAPVVRAAIYTVTPTTPGGLQSAIATAKPGDTIEVVTGDYAGFTIGWDAAGKYGPIGGTAVAPITIRRSPSAPAGSVRITSAGLLADNGQKGSNGIYLNEGASNSGKLNWIIIDGFTISPMPRYGIYVGRSKGVTIRNCTVTGAGTFGINTSHTTDCTLENNTVSGSKGSDTSGHGIYVANDALRPIVRGNILFSNGSEGLHMNGDRTQGGTGMVDSALVENNVIYNNVANAINCDGIKNSVFQNNLIYNNGNHGIALYKADGAAGSTNNRIINNTIYQPNSGGAAIKPMDGATGNIVNHNILIGGRYGSYNFSTDSKPGLISDFNIVVDKFVNETTGATTNLAQWKAAGQDAHSTIQKAADIFVDVAKNDFRLKGLGIGSGYTYGTVATQPSTQPATIPATQPDPVIAQLQAQLAAANAQLSALANQLASSQADVTAKEELIKLLQADVDAGKQAVAALQAKITAAAAALQ